jgi:hypothetical protein
MVNWRTEIRFSVTGKKEPLPTTIEEGAGGQGIDERERVPASEVIWEVTPELKYHSVF